MEIVSVLEIVSILEIVNVLEIVSVLEIANGDVESVMNDVVVTEISFFCSQEIAMIFWEMWNFDEEEIVF